MRITGAASPALYLSSRAESVWRSSYGNWSLSSLSRHTASRSGCHLSVRRRQAPIYGRDEIRGSRIPQPTLLGYPVSQWIGVKGVQDNCSSLTGAIPSRAFRRYAERMGRTPVSRDPRSYGTIFTIFGSPSSAGGGDLVFLSVSACAALRLIGVNSCRAKMPTADPGQISR